MKLLFECVSTLCKHLVSHLILMLPEVRALSGLGFSLEFNWH